MKKAAIAASIMGSFALGAQLIVVGSRPAPSPATFALASSCGSHSDPSKLGWLNGVELTAADRRRIAFFEGITRPATDKPGSQTQEIRQQVNRCDFELEHQNRRQAHASHPNANLNNLFLPVRIDSEPEAEIPAEFCTSGNSETVTVKGVKYLTSCVIAVVNPRYKRRAHARETVDFFAHLRKSAARPALAPAP